MIVQLGSDSLAEFVANAPVCVIDFMAPWCGPCQQIEKILPRLAEELGETARIGKVNADQNPSLREEFQITGYPTFVFFKNGQEVYRQKGVMRLAEIKGKLESL